MNEHILVDLNAANLEVEWTIPPWEDEATAPLTLQTPHPLLRWLGADANQRSVR
jgi:hypothetical protein